MTRDADPPDELHDELLDECEAYREIVASQAQLENS